MRELMRGVRFLGEKGGTPRAAFPLPRAPGERCLEPRPVPARAPPNSRARWTPGRGVRVDKAGGGRGSAGLPYLARPAPARGEAERSRGHGAPAPARSPARRLCALQPPARSPRRFQSPPAPPPARPAPGPSSVPPHSRSSSPNPASASLQPAPRLRALRLRLGSFARPRPGAVRRVVLSPRALPLCAAAGASRRPPPRSQTASQRAAGTGHGAGKVTEPREARTMLWVPICQSKGAGPRVVGCH